VAVGGVSDLRDLAWFWAVDVLWRALGETVGILRRHVGKELILAGAVLLVAFVGNADSTFVDQLVESLVLLALVAAIYGGALFVWQFAMTPVRVKREVEADRDRMRDETVAALRHSTEIQRKYGSNITQKPSLSVVALQLGTELRDIRHKIELVRSTQPTPHYSHGFRLPAFRWNEYAEILAEQPDLYAVIENAYTAAHHVNEALNMRETRAPGKTIGVMPDDGLDAAYEASGAALEKLGHLPEFRESTRRDEEIQLLRDEAHRRSEELALLREQVERDRDQRREAQAARLTVTPREVDGSSRSISYTFEITNAGPHFTTNLLLRLRGQDGKLAGETWHREAILPGTPAVAVTVETPPRDRFHGPYTVEASWEDGRGRVVRNIGLEVGSP
jgi:hypothetical protein